MSVEAFFDRLGLPEASRVDKRIFKRMVLDHGKLTAADKKALSDDVSKLTWKYALKADTVQVLPYEDAEREYLEIAIVEALLSNRGRAARIAEIIQRAIPYPVLLVLVEGSGLCLNVAHKRFSRAEEGGIVAEGFLCSPWLEQPLSDLDREFCQALALSRLSRVDFFALYRGMVNAVLARMCAEFSGTLVVDGRQPEQDRRQRLEQCHDLDREITSLRAVIRDQNRFADQVELNTRIKELEARLLEAKAGL
ncbi:MAG: DUF4391 domain-containing protein [Deltaproteobacteria bacterium]|nr:DUF4391 domain-containing protein [Deltaproteobacteria bacterium]